MNKKKNLVTALILQAVTMLSGLILPRLIITTFGSELNGMLSSITQFLSFISLLEGGLGAVVLAELYKPLEQRDDAKINSILWSCQKFFFQLSIVFLVYTVILGGIYSYSLKDRYSFGYVCSLVFILSFTTLIQYLFSITYKLLLQAQQRIYLVNIISFATIIINLLVSVALIYYFPEIHIIKLGSALIFLIQPLIYSYFTNKKYKHYKSAKIDDDYKLSNRWNGFAQNLAHFVNLNTDIAMITIFLSLSEVSVYSIYMLPITALRSLIASMTNSYHSALGKYNAQEDYIQLKKSFTKFDNMNSMVSVSIFCTCILLINPFVKLYTKGIADADYYRPIFAVLIILANMLYSMREPYRYLILAAGKFKETNFGAILEAILNLLISFILIKKLGLVGVAIGTLIAISYRFAYFIVYLKKNILAKPYKDYFYFLLKTALIVGVTVLIYLTVNFEINNFFTFCIYGALIFVIEIVISYFLYIRIGINGGNNISGGKKQ